MTQPKPFTVQVSDADIADLHRRIDQTRWPDQVNDDRWSYGTELNYLKELVDYWRHQYDWRAHEARLNRFEHYTLAIDGLRTHFIHQRSTHADAMPLLITHGWPGSVVEFLDIIQPLTQPERFGGDSKDAFHVICPSLPGYGWSEAAHTPGMNVPAIAKRHVQLMAALGYSRYLVQGGDWGAMVSRETAAQDTTHCVGIHLNMIPPFPPSDLDNPDALMTEQEAKSMALFQRFMQDGSGYQAIQGTRPQTLGYGLADSPVGLCGWLTEKFRAWTDCRGEIRNAISWDALLTNVSVYWFTNCICSSTRIYLENLRNPEITEKLSQPFAAAIFPRELMWPPKKWVEHSYNLKQWSVMEKGGHFAAMEQPALLVEDLRRFRRALDS